MWLTSKTRWRLLGMTWVFSLSTSCITLLLPSALWCFISSAALVSTSVSLICPRSPPMSPPPNTRHISFPPFSFGSIACSLTLFRSVKTSFAGTCWLSSRFMSSYQYVCRLGTGDLTLQADLTMSLLLELTSSLFKMPSPAPQGSFQICIRSINTQKARATGRQYFLSVNAMVNSIPISI